ncbi:MAG: peptidoglycan hydrolase-like protein with peptidoglycan-binding domain [Polyangiales bacterium]|jgi:peptidoglycan hydrolase-like protein with peptidoglycan-binding domain
MGLLKNGSKGDAVTQLQNDMNTLGFTIGTDGLFGPNTLSAIEQLQWMFGYDIDGMVGNGTQGLISSQVKNGWNAGTRDGIVNALKAQGKTAESGAIEGIELKRTLKSGVEGSDVAYTQRRLRALGFKSPLSAVFDPGTESAVKELQTAFGYDVDGMVGPGTHKLINAQLGYGWSKGEAASK